jgi:hypothetical protein
MLLHFGLVCDLCEFLHNKSFFSHGNAFAFEIKYPCRLGRASTSQVAQNRAQAAQENKEVISIAPITRIERSHRQGTPKHRSQAAPTMHEHYTMTAVDLRCLLRLLLTKRGAVAFCAQNTRIRQLFPCFNSFLKS